MTAYLLDLDRCLDLGDILLNILFQFVQRDLLPYFARHCDDIYSLTVLLACFN